MQLRHTKYGSLKHFICASVLLLGGIIEVRADPITAFLAANWVAIAVSAALSAASIGMQILFQPKPKPQDKNKLQGDIQLSNIGEDIPITEISGASLGDSIGGIKIGGTIIHASPIRKVVITTPGGGGGGGKGAPKAPPTKEHHYYIDLAILWSRGPCRIKQIKANTDIIYQGFTPNPYLIGTGYEAEDRTGDSANVTEVADVDMSGGLKVNLDQNEWIEWNNIAAGDVESREMFVVYKSSADIDIELTVNGATSYPVLPDSFAIRANVNLPQNLTIGSTNTIRIKNLTNAVLSVDRIVVGLDPIFDPGDGGCFLSNVRYQGWQNPEPVYDYMGLRDVYMPDDRACEQYNYQANPNSRGEIAANVVNNGVVRIYPGNQTQLPDPLMQEHFEALYGAGSTPAFRGRCYSVFENFEITKYGTVPNFTAVVEHETINSLGELYADLAVRAGLDPTEFDFTDLDGVPLRGYAVAEKRSPAKTMEILGRITDTDVYTDFDGKIIGVIPDETIVATIPLSELDTVENAEIKDGDNKPFQPVVTTIRDETEIPCFLDVSFFDASQDWDTRNVHALREIDTSDRKNNIQTELVMTESEAQKFADRDLHKQYVEKDGLQINAFHKHSYLTPTNLIRVTDTDGSTPAMRIKTMEGWIPGSLGIKGVSRDASEFPPRWFATAGAPVVPGVHPPTPIIGTFIDLSTFREEQTAGFYVAACLTDTHYHWAGAGLYREIEGDEWEALDGIPNQSTMGLTVGVLGDPPVGWVAGDWDDDNTLAVDLYYSELETLADEQVLQGRNFAIVGNEIIQFATATRDNGFPNRWIISRLQRKLRGTGSDIPIVHSSNERFVLYTAAWRWIEQDPALANVTRTYKFVGSGGDLDTASSVDFNWSGRTQFNTPIYNSVDNGVPILGPDPPVVSAEGGFWTVSIQRPVGNGFSASIAEARARRAGDDFVLRYVDMGNTVISPPILEPFDQCKVDYRWRNAYRLFGSDGWSAWSAIAVVTPGSVDPPPPIIVGGDPTGPADIFPVCFIDGTLVLMADWSEKRIEEIAIDDYVMAWAPEGRLMPSRVANLMPAETKKYREIVLTDDVLGVTESHPFLPDFNRKMRVKDMEKGQTLRQYDRGWKFTKVVSTKEKRRKAAIRVTNFEVETWHTYFVRGEGKGWKAVYNMKMSDY